VNTKSLEDHPDPQLKTLSHPTVQISQVIHYSPFNQNLRWFFQMVRYTQCMRSFQTFQIGDSERDIAPSVLPSTRVSYNTLQSSYSLNIVGKYIQTWVGNMQDSCQVPPEVWYQALYKYLRLQCLQKTHQTFIFKMLDLSFISFFSYSSDFFSWLVACMHHKNVTPCLVTQVLKRGDNLRIDTHTIRTVLRSK